MEASGAFQNLIKEMQRGYYCYYNFSSGQQKTNIVNGKAETQKYEGKNPKQIPNNWVFHGCQAFCSSSPEQIGLIIKILRILNEFCFEMTTIFFYFVFPSTSVLES